MRQHCALLLLPGLLLLAGCGSGPAAPVEATGPTATATAPAVEVSVLSWEETQQLVAQQSGRVVVVDLWTTW